MKKAIFVFCILALLCAFAACKNRSGNEEPTAPTPDDTAGSDAALVESSTLTLRLIDGAGTQRLVLAGEKNGEVYTLNAEELTVYTDGEKADPADLQNGIRLSFDEGYELLESWPMQIRGTSLCAQIVTGDQTDHGDLCGVYLQVLEDLWTEDSGLNGGIAYISVDLDDAPGGLTDGEKAAIAWIFSGRHNAQGLQYGFNELKENGYVDDIATGWENGVLFSITASENGKNTAKKITFDAEKWRSGLGAIFFTDCTAKRGSDAAWEPYEPGGFAIS